MEGAGAGAGAAYTTCTAEEVLCGRRAGTIRALTDDVDTFFKLCVPGERFRSPRVSPLCRGLWNVEVSCVVIV